MICLHALVAGGRRNASTPARYLNRSALLSIFFFNDTATTEIYTLSLHDALPIFGCCANSSNGMRAATTWCSSVLARDRKSTRLNSSHGYISYAVFCLQKNRCPPGGGRRSPSSPRG